MPSNNLYSRWTIVTGLATNQIRPQVDLWQKAIAEKSASQENSTDESSSSKEKTQSSNNEVKDLSDVSSLKEQKEKISLEQNIDTA